MRTSTAGKTKEANMPENVDDIIAKPGPARRKKVEARAAELIAEEMTLRQLRKARKLTQVRVAKTLGITQDSVSRLEKRSDLLLSTLRKTVEAMGGRLSLVAEFSDRAPVVLSGIAGDDPKPRPRGRKAA
jgi:DNA-binding XRE family transcriptional regulator